MEKLTLRQFQQLTALPDFALAWLLKNNKLKCTLDPQGAILIEPDGISPELLHAAFTAQSEELLADDYEVIVDRIIDVVDQRLDMAMNEALARLGERPGREGNDE